MAETVPQEPKHGPDSLGARPRARPVPGRRLPAAIPSARLAARTAPHGARELADAQRTGSLAEIVRAKRTLVVTYRRDGTPVPTPVWAAEADGVLYVRTERASGKVKRLRRDPRMLIAPCTKLGRPLGAPLEASGRMLTGAQELPAEAALVSRYGFGRWLFERTMDVLRVDMGYLEITPGAWRDGEAS
ncbi:MAG TPA: PPOX class F420-dependent oxidoreductase [Solirubrobacteraceae bacterium]|jgi:PPOX class probable F420-dependent enzyme|nr:PPOX class F420-dependent oxidoreductase [Solirubrobacteraceae bacterium]